MSQKYITRYGPRLGFLAWGLSLVFASFLIDGHDALRDFHGQTLAVKIGAFLGLLAFFSGLVFAGCLLMISTRNNSIEPALNLLPWSSRAGRPKAISFMMVCGACALVFLFFSIIFLRIILL